MNRLTSLLTSTGIGAGLMYVLDPDRGNRRRSLMRDQLRHAMRKTADGADVTMRDVRNRLYGTAAELRSLFTSDHPSDEVLVSRVRSKMGRYVTHPSAIEVCAREGVVVLSGPILAHEVDDLLCAVKSVRGVQEVDNQLEVHESPDDIPALQGAGRRWGEPPDLLQTYWAPATRVAVGALGTALMLNCARRRKPLGALGGLLGFGLVLRALTNLETKRLLGLGGRRGIDIHKTITINRPVDEVFLVLADPASYPEFTDLITCVCDEGGGVFEKTIAGPAGAAIKVRERITCLVPNEFVAVRSEPDSPLKYAGRAWFVPLDECSTKVEIQATYNPPGGVLTHAAARIAGLDLKSVLDDVLMRAKSYIETGKIPHDAAILEGQACERQTV